jgi:hypothetical protein
VCGEKGRERKREEGLRGGGGDGEENRKRGRALTRVLGRRDLNVAVTLLGSTPTRRHLAQAVDHGCRTQSLRVREMSLRAKIDIFICWKVVFRVNGSHINRKVAPLSVAPLMHQSERWLP